MGDFVTASKTAFQDEDATFVGINVNAFDANKLRSIPVVADAREALVALTEALDAAGWAGTTQAYRDKAGDLKEQWDAKVTAHRTPSAASRGSSPSRRSSGSSTTPSAATRRVICAAGSLPGDLLKLWRPEDPKAYHLEYGYSCMGYEIPAGIGVKMAEPGARSSS